MGIGPFAYVTFIVAFLKFNDAAYDTRQSVHKTLGVVSFLFILVNQLTGSGMLFLDIGLFLFAGYFFYRAMSENFETVSTAALSVMLVCAGIYGLMAWREARDAAAEARKKGSASGVPGVTEAELKKALETATKALQREPPPDLR